MKRGREPETEASDHAKKSRVRTNKIIPLEPVPVHETKWSSEQVKVALNMVLDETKTEDGDTRCCNLIVLDNLFGEAERKELHECLTGNEGGSSEETSSSSAAGSSQQQQQQQQPPPPSKWEKSTADGKDLPVTYGLKSDVLKKLCSGELKSVREIWSRLQLLYPQYKICLQPGNEHFTTQNAREPSSTPKHVCWPVVGNAPVAGDEYRYHYDGDPASFPPSNWTQEFGSYVNHEPGKPLFVSLLVYLCRYWRRDFLAETLFLDDDTDTGIFVRPKPYRAILMDQDLLHRVSVPSKVANEPRYSVVWKLVFIPKQENVTCTLAREDWGVPHPFGSTIEGPYQRKKEMGEISSPVAIRGGKDGATNEPSRGNFLRGVPHQQRTLSAPKIHAFRTNEQIFTVDAKYEPLNEIGRGAYGFVCAARDSKANKKVAIKKVPKVFADLIDAKRVLREIKLLRHFHHENVIGLYDLIASPSIEKFTDMYIVLNLMETDLHKIIHSRNELSDDHIQYFVYQILRGLKYIHSAQVMHRDLKPSNILLNGDCDLKICDFGLARGVGDNEFVNLTEYVVTRWYRAPEVMCSCREYDHKIDVWSVGCIMAELHGRKPLFPGKDYIQQMNLIFNLTGSPTKEDTAFITNTKALQWIQSLENREPVPLERLYQDANPTALDLLGKMLVFNPNRRISVEEALDHPYFRNLRDRDTETTCDLAFDFEFERMSLTEENVKRAMYGEVMLFRPYLNDDEKSRTEEAD